MHVVPCAIMPSAWGGTFGAASPFRLDVVTAKGPSLAERRIEASPHAMRIGEAGAAVANRAMPPAASIPSVHGAIAAGAAQRLPLAERLTWAGPRGLSRKRRGQAPLPREAPSSDSASTAHHA